MTSEMRKKLAQESYEEKIRKVGMLIRLIKKAPKLGKRDDQSLITSAAKEIWRD
jgi:hypothetical protein